MAVPSAFSLFHYRNEIIIACRLVNGSCYEPPYQLHGLYLLVTLLTVPMR